MIDVHILCAPGREEWRKQALASLAGYTVHQIVGSEWETGRADGFALGSHEYVSFVDDDDYLIGAGLDPLFNALKKYPQAVGAYGDQLIVDAAGKPQGISSSAYNPVWRPLDHLAACVVKQPVVYRREHVLKHLDDIRRHGVYIPYLLGGLLAQYGPFVHVPVATYIKRDHANSMINRADLRIRKAIAKQIVSIAKGWRGTVPVIEQPDEKVFCIGLGKTGLQSLAYMLRVLGYAVSDADIHRENRIGLRGDFSADPFLHYAACIDVPIPAFYRELDVRYPGSKFILTERDSVAWLASAKARFSQHRAEGGHADYVNIMREAVYGAPEWDEEKFKRRYKQHNADVKAYFSGRDLLVLSSTSTDQRQEQLRAFLAAE